MISKFSTETLKVQTFSSTKMVRQNLEIWMYLRLLRKDYCTLKRVPLTMHRPRSGVTSLMITNRIFGRWDAFCMSLLPLNHLSEPKICKVCIKRCWEEFTLKFQTYFRMNWPKRSSFWSKSLHKWDRAVTRSWRCQLSEKRWTNCSPGIALMTRNRKWICLAQSGCPRTFFISPIDCQSRCMTLMIGTAMSRKKCLGEGPTRVLIHIKQCYLKFKAIKEVKREASTPVLSLTSDQPINMREVRTLETWVVRRTAKSSNPRKLHRTLTTKTKENRFSRMPKTKINRLERAKKDS